MIDTKSRSSLLGHLSPVPGNDRLPSCVWVLRAGRGRWFACTRVVEDREEKREAEIVEPKGGGEGRSTELWGPFVLSPFFSLFRFPADEGVVMYAACERSGWDSITGHAPKRVWITWCLSCSAWLGHTYTHTWCTKIQYHLYFALNTERDIDKFLGF